LYDFSSAPVSATISIAGEGGGTVATTATTEKDGWLYLSAAGFTFSEKLIQVKITQEPVKSEPQPTPTPSSAATPTAASTLSPAPTPKPSKLVSITCVKGKTKRVISSQKPKCPSGFRKI